ncbi:MAG: ornithine carbamoyltransferase [Rhodobacteraceae bacterium]|nr:ornithine carbamoyltransferase [Paracoccaceae bacterium]
MTYEPTQHELQGRSLLTLNEFTTAELTFILDRAVTLKKARARGERGDGLLRRNICGIFEKPSGRTSTAFVVATNDEGGHLEFFPTDNIRFGYKESVKDLAKLIGGIFDGIAFRGFAQETAETLARYSGLPVWNGLTDDHHPTQLLADVMTLRESFGDLSGLRVAYVGDGRNNVVRSLAVGALKFGYKLSIVAPTELQPDAAMIAGIEAATPERNGSIVSGSDIAVGVLDAAAIYTDVWVSMGEEDQTEARITLLRDYRITQEMMAATGRDDTIFLHCLPAFHDLETEIARRFPDICEVDNTVFEGPASRVFQQAQNRMHTIKALMLETVQR